MKKDKDVSRKKPKRDKVSYVLGLRNQTPRYFSLEWTFVEPVEITVVVKGPTDPTRPIHPNEFVLCSGPYIYVFDAIQTMDKPFSFCRQISVFESTGTFVRGVVKHGDFYLAWGGSYITRIIEANIEQAKTICVKDIISTGRQIVSVRPAEVSETEKNTAAAKAFRAEIYYTDGIIEVVEIGINKLLTVKLLQRFRLPLEPREKVTCASVKLPQTDIGVDKPKTLFLGTNYGRIIVAEPDFPVFVINTEINIPIRQVLIMSSKNTNAAPAIMILFENGSIVYWYNYQKDKANIVEFKGRFTYIHHSCDSNMFAIKARNWDCVFAGDRDGHLTILWVSGKIIKIARTVKHVASNKITVITDGNLYNLFIGTELGDYNLLELTQFYGLFYDSRVPQSVADSYCYYKTRTGWYFLKDDLFGITTTKGKLLVHKNSFAKKRWQMRYLCCTAKPEREIVAVYNEFEVIARISDIECKKNFYWNSDSQIKQRVTKVILMKSYILLHYDQQATVSSVIEELLYIDTGGSTCVLVVRCENVKGTITSAVCLEDRNTEEKSTIRILHLIIGYRIGKLKLDIIEWNMITMETKFRCSHEIEVPNGYIVSMITSREHLANIQFTSLNYNGKASFFTTENFDGNTTYKIHAHQDLSPLIGRGHSLFETSEGILAAGFKQHALNICWIYMGTAMHPQYSYLFCIDTRSSRLPYTIIEEQTRENKKESWKKKAKVVVSYYSEKGIKEQCFPIFKTHSINGFKHSGIITNSYVKNCYRFCRKEEEKHFHLKEEDEAAKHFVIYTGDTDEKFCVWTLETENCYVRKYKYYADFKLTGAVTSIHEEMGMVFVATSQGYLYPYKSSNYFQLFPMTPLKMNQKINYLISYVGQDLFLHLLAFLEDGTVDNVLIKSRGHMAVTKLDPDIQKVAQFPVATKMAIHIGNEKERYVAALGVDGILRRAPLSSSGNELVEMRWKISVIKKVSIDEKNLLMVGDPQGWVYVTFSSDAVGFSFEIDCYHKHEVVDITCQVTKERDLFIFSLDITGTVIIRNMKNSRKTIEPLQNKFPLIWVSPVPSPRKLMVIPEREIMVVGKGVATKIF